MIKQIKNLLSKFSLPTRQIHQSASKLLELTDTETSLIVGGGQKIEIGEYGG